MRIPRNHKNQRYTMRSVRTYNRMASQMNSGAGESSQGGGVVVNNGLLLEDNTSFILLEDNSSVLLKEAA